MNNEYQTKLEAFRALVELHQLVNLKLSRVDCEANRINSKAQIKPGTKYDKVDKSGSGRFMVEGRTGEIFGIKGYGVIHRGHPYGTLDTIGDWYWGCYYPAKWADAPFTREEFEAAKAEVLANTPAAQ